jgi:hypothetical protein
MSARPAPAWLNDVLLAERFGWTYDQIAATPHWFVERLFLWVDVKAAWQKRQRSE